MRVMGRDHPNTLNTAADLAANLLRLQYTVARQLFEATLSKRNGACSDLPSPRSTQWACSTTCRAAGHGSRRGGLRSGAAAARRHSRARATARRQARAQRQACSRRVFRRTELAVPRGAGRGEGAVAQGRMRGASGMRGNGLCLGGDTARASASGPAGAWCVVRSAHPGHRATLRLLNLVW